MTTPAKPAMPRGITPISQERLASVARDIQLVAKTPGRELTETEFRQYLPGLIGSGDESDAQVIRALYTERLGGPRNPCTVLMDNGEKVYVPPLREFDMDAQITSNRRHGTALANADRMASDYPIRARNEVSAVIDDLESLARPPNSREWAQAWTVALNKFGVDVHASQPAARKTSDQPGSDLSDVNPFDVE